MIQQVQDGSGRVRIVQKDEAATQYSSSSIDLSRRSEVQQLITIDVEGVTRGQRLVTATVADDPASGPAHQYLYADCLVVGHIGPTPVLLGRFALDSAQNQARIEFGDAQTFQALSVWGRQVVDGAGDSQVTPKALTLQATGTFWR